MFCMHQERNQKGALVLLVFHIFKVWALDFIEKKSKDFIEKKSKDFIEKNSKEIK